MVIISGRLVCQGEGCQASWPPQVLGHDLLFARDIIALRQKALEAGWKRFRPKNTAANADYCPACVAKLRPGA